MHTTDENTARLHQEASAHYLQGQFIEALAIWRQILAANPQDERALEGVRLCELLTEDVDPAVDSVEVVQPASAESIEVTDPIDLQIPELLVGAVDSNKSPGRQMEGMDLGEVPETLSLAGNPLEIPEVELVADDLIEPVVEPEAVAIDATAAELQNRVQNLILEANAANANGEPETARGILARVFILDENNTQALALQSRIDAVDGAASESGAADFVLGPEIPEVQVPGATMPIEPMIGEDDPLIDAAIDQPFDEAHMVDPDAAVPDDDELDLDPVPAPAAKRFNLPQLNAGRKTTMIVIGAVVLGVVVVGVGFWMKLQATQIREGDAPAPPPRANTAAQPPAGQPEDTPAEQPQPALAQPVQGDVSTLLAQGREAFDSGDYAAAIVSYHAVLAQQPANVEAIERMEVASEAYKEQQAVQKQWTAAMSLFSDGDYRSALKMFYRLSTETDADRERLDRYKENGWYNMGVLALRGSQCDLARSHLHEARELDLEDSGISTAEALCASCDSGRSSKGYQRAVAAIPLRGLDD